MTLFDKVEKEHRDRARPLAARMRPRTLGELVGQRHLIGEGRLLRRLLVADRLGSLVLHGPPGTGKTTLARLLAGESRSHFVPISAVTSNVRELRELLAAARRRLETGGQRTLLFVDEIHRFNKAQQDVLLGDVEEGVVHLVGATTENPFFAVNRALVSRSNIFRLDALEPEDIKTLLRRALADRERGLGDWPVEVDDDALDVLAELCDGDARRALSALEVGVLGVAGAERAPVHLTAALARESIQSKAVDYDRDGDAHHDAASALIKSIRGSDPDAAVYWLARMLEGGEEVRFLARRLVILASEDIGNADPHALPLAVAAMHGCEFVGLPECQLILAQAVTYLACAPKSNAATVAIGEARTDVREKRLVPVPTHLRSVAADGSRHAGPEAAYVSPHDRPGGVVAQEYLGVERLYYRPVDRGFERRLAERLEELRRQVRAGRTDGPPPR